MSDGLAIPADWSEVDAEWMTAALQASFPGVVVDGVGPLERDDGTNRRARLSLTYAKGRGPASVFLKGADPAHAELNAKTGGLFNEVWLFQSGVELGADHPAVHLALVDVDALDFLLVMEDVVETGGDPRDATRPLTVDQAAAGVEGLARLHATHWGTVGRSDSPLAWVEPLRAWRGMGRGVDLGMAAVGDLVPAAVRDLPGDVIADIWTSFVATVSDGPPALLHGDAHVGNTYVLPDGGVGFLDWQVVRAGHPALDLGYFLQGALTVDDRRIAERDLLAAYLDALVVSPDERPSLDDLWLRYRASVAHGLTLWLATAASVWQRAEVSAALASRYAAAWVDLETARAVEELAGH